MAAVFPSIYNKRKASFKGVVVLMPGTKAIPSNNSGAMRTLLDRGLATRRDAPGSIFTLYGGGPDEYRPFLLDVLPALKRLHHGGAAYDFVRRGDSGNAIDEARAGNYHHAHYPAGGVASRVSITPKACTIRAQ